MIFTVGPIQGGTNPPLLYGSREGVVRIDECWRDQSPKGKVRVDVRIIIIVKERLSKATGAASARRRPLERRLPPE